MVDTAVEPEPPVTFSVAATPFSSKPVIVKVFPESLPPETKVTILPSPNGVPACGSMPPIVDATEVITIVPAPGDAEADMVVADAAFGNNLIRILQLISPANTADKILLSSTLD